MREHFSLATPLRLEQEISLEHAVINGPLGETTGLSGLMSAKAGYLSFCDREPAPELAVIESGAMVLTTTDLYPSLISRFPGVTWISTPDPRADFIDLSQKLLASGVLDISNAVPRPFGVHTTASIGSHAVIHPNVRIDEGVIIGEHCVIHRGTWIRENSVIRDHAVIGCEGINAYRGLDGRQRGFPHLASVLIGESCEIGAGSVIPRGILTSTVVGNHVVVGNLCNIGHGVVVEDNVWMSVGCLVGGHTSIGKKATLAMGVTVRDNLRIGAEAQVGMGSVVVRDVEAGVSIFGNPARLAGNKVKAGPER